MLGVTYVLAKSAGKRIGSINGICTPPPRQRPLQRPPPAATLGNHHFAGVPVFGHRAEDGQPGGWAGARRSAGGGGSWRGRRKVSGDGKTMKPDVGFVGCIEGGVLETQALLLAERLPPAAGCLTA